MIEISKISSSYDIRRLDDSDVDSILSFCQKNTQYYEYCEAEPTREQVINDLHMTPPGIGLSEKYYIGFYQKETLVAVMDLIDGYPEPDSAFIGFGDYSGNRSLSESHGKNRDPAGHRQRQPAIHAFLEKEWIYRGQRG